MPFLKANMRSLESLTGLTRSGAPGHLATQALRWGEPMPGPEAGPEEEELEGIETVGAAYDLVVGKI